MLREKGYKSRALLGGFGAWINAEGETESAAEVRPNVTTQNTNGAQPPQQNAGRQQQEQHVVASPNPTVDDSKTASDGAKKVEGVRVQPAQSRKAAPMKSKTKSRKAKRHRRRG